MIEKLITYAVEEHDPNSFYEVTFKSVYEGDWDFAAMECAKDYFHNHDGWEAAWPLTFQIRHEEKLIGTYEMEMEPVPNFYVGKVIKNG